MAGYVEYVDKEEINKKRLHAALEELQRALVRTCSKLTTSVEVFINCEGYSTQITESDPASLKRDGVSMRNIAGYFIE